MRGKRNVVSFMVIGIIIGFLIIVTPTTQAEKNESGSDEYMESIYNGVQLDTRETTVQAETNEPIFYEYMVPMRDGVQLYTRVYLPGPGEYPVILTRTPYGIGAPTWYGGVAPDPTDPTQWPYEVLNGYAYVTQDTRGRYFSEGMYRFFYDDGVDGYDTIEWVADQDWCIGKVGMAGYSAPGITTFLAAGEKPPHLVAIAPLSSSADVQSEITFDGGAFRGDSTMWGLYQTVVGLSQVPNGHIDHLGLNQNEYQYHTLQILSELNDRMTHLAWHSGLDGAFPNATGSTYWMHLPLSDLNPSYSALQPYANEVISHPDEDDWRNYFNVYDKVDVPTLLLTGWNDFFSKYQIDVFSTLQNREVPVKLLVGPGTHGDAGILPPYYEWFDYWLKDIDTGIMDEPPILYYSLEADEWCWADQWPPGGVKNINFYLHDGGLLSTYPCAYGEISDNFIYNPTDPVLTMGGTNLFLSPGSFDQTPVVYGRDDILSYTTPPLTKSVEIAGPLEVFLSASSNCTDTDFTVKLIDVHPSGELMQVADGIIRARYRNSMANPELMSGDSNDVYKFKIDMGDICQVFKVDHCIRVDISSSNFPKHDRNLNTGGKLYTETEILIAENTIHHNAKNPSYIVLPIKSLKDKVYEGYACIKTPELNYKGLAELHTYEHAVYVHFEDQWIKWEITFHLKCCNIELYWCKGELGRLRVIVFHSKDGSYAIALGRKFWFHSQAI